MPAPASMRQTAQVGLEASYGAASTTITKRFTSFGLAKSRNFGTANATPRGQTAPTQGWISTEDSAFSIDGGVLSYDEVVYLLHSVCNKATRTQPTGGTVLSNQRLYTIDQFASTTFQSYAIEAGDVGNPVGTGRGGKAKGGTVQEWGFSVSSTDDTVGMSGNFVGWQLVDGTMTQSVASTDFSPVIPKHFTLKYSTVSQSNLVSSGVAINNSFNAEFNIGDRRSLVRFLGNATGSPSDIVETTPDLSFSLTLADEASPVDTFLTQLRAGGKIWFRLQALHTTALELAIFPELTLDVCCTLADSPSDDDSDGVQVVNFPLQPTYDPNWTGGGKIFEIKTVSGVNATTLP